MAENIEYKGLSVTIWANEISKGRWTWEYSVPGQNIKSNPDGPLRTEQLAISEATDCAKRDIDAMG